MSINIMTLPHDALQLTLSYLSAKELASIALVNKQFNQISEEISNRIIQEIRKKYFPVSLSENIQISNSNMKRLLYRLTIKQIYTIGGAFNSDQMNCYLPKSNCWHMSPDLKFEREGSCAVIVRGYIAVLSGESDSSTSKVELFSLLENRWSQLPSIPKMLRGMACATVDDKIIVVGGQNVVQGLAVSSVHVLDLNMSIPSNFSKSKKDWVTYESVMLESRYAHAAVWYNDELWVAGGTTNAAPYSSSVETMCFKNGELVMGNSMPPMCNGRRNFQLHVLEDKLYAVGGDEDCTIECFDFDNNSWRVISTLPVFIRNFASTSDGKNIFIFGGQDRRRQFLKSWSCFDTQNEQWTVSKGKMPIPDSPGFSHGCAITMNFDKIKW